jgi:hypothetical protein
MQLAVETLLDGAMRTLREAVLPAVEGRFARGQLFAVLDVLQNLRDRVEPKAALADAEAASTAAALRRVAQLVGPDAASTLAQAIDAAPAAPPAARAAALRAALVQAFRILDDLPDAIAAPARTVLAEHLAAQAMRDVALLKPSLLQEISKG